VRHALASIVLIGFAAGAMPAYALPSCTGIFTSNAAAGTSSGTIEQCTITTTGIYDITAYAASGGSGRSGAGGAGAEIGGTVSLMANTVLDILVGVAGGSGPISGGGGGGTFVALQGSPDTPLIVAGGGGGGGYNGYAGAIGSASVDTNPSGGRAYAGGGGGGYSGNGDSFHGAGGQSFLNGGAGAISQESQGSGGFGGGGGGSGYCCGGAGGGGGYHGGDGNGTLSGGGGASYLDPSVTQLVGISGKNQGNGEVDISLIASIPEPGSLAILGFGALTLIARRFSTR
jgi:hypothetical protein